MPSPSNGDGAVDKFIDKVNASLGRIASKPREAWQKTVDAEIARYDPGEREFVSSYLGAQIHRLKTNDTPTAGQALLVIGLSLAFLVVLLALAWGVSQLVGNYLTALSVTAAALMILALPPLVFALPKPTDLQVSLIRTYVALACAGVAAGLPGFIQLESKTAQFAISAGGALAIFLVIYWKNPADPRKRRR